MRLSQENHCGTIDSCKESITVIACPIIYLGPYSQLCCEFLDSPAKVWTSRKTVFSISWQYCNWNQFEWGFGDSSLSLSLAPCLTVCMSIWDRANFSIWSQEGLTFEPSTQQEWLCLSSRGLRQGSDHRGPFTWEWWQGNLPFQVQ